VATTPIGHKGQVGFSYATQVLAEPCDFGAFRDRAIILRSRSGLNESKLRQKLNNEAALNLAGAKTISINEEANLRHERLLQRRVPFNFVSSQLTEVCFGPCRFLPTPGVALCDGPYNMSVVGEEERLAPLPRNRSCRP